MTSRTGTRAPRGRRIVAVAMFLLGATSLLFPTLAVAQDPRTDTDLLGYDLETTARPIAVRIYEDFIPIPVDPGDPQFEVVLSYSGTRLGTGPRGRAVASSIWPGGGIGDGFGAVVCANQGEDCDDSQTYPIRANANYPGGGQDSWTQTTEAAENLGMYAEALGLDVRARAEGGGVPAALEELIDVGNVRSQTSSIVKDGKAVSRTVSEVTNLSIAGGTIVIESLSTTLEASSDGEAGATTGETVIGGITVLGQPAKLSSDGIVIAPPSEDAEGEGEDEPANPLADIVAPVGDIVTGVLNDLVGDGAEEALGLSVTALEQTETVEGPIAERLAEGLNVSIDLTVLNGVLQPLLRTAGYQELLGMLPDEAGDLRGYLLELAQFTPRIEVVVGRGFAAASASPPFEPPPLPDLPPAAPPSTGGVSGGFDAPTTSSGGFGGTTTGSSGSLDTPPAAEVAPPETPSVAAPAAGDDPFRRFGGVPPILLAFGLMAGAVPVWGLQNLRELAVGAGASTAVDQSLPDLRGGA